MCPLTFSPGHPSNNADWGSLTCIIVLIYEKREFCPHIAFDYRLWSGLCRLLMSLIVVGLEPGDIEVDARLRHKARQVRSAG